MLQYALYIGLNDKDTKRQEIATDAAVRIVSDAAYNFTDGATISTAAGLYKHADGTRVRENTIVLTICDYDETRRASVDAIAAYLKTALNQESIQITAAPLVVCALV